MYSASTAQASASSSRALRAALSVCTLLVVAGCAEQQLDPSSFLGGDDDAALFDDATVDDAPALSFDVPSATDVVKTTDVVATHDTVTPADLVTAPDVVMSADVVAATDVVAPVDVVTARDVVAPVDVVAPCGAGLLRCDADCVDPRSDPNHCGACRNPCGAGRRCVSSVCVLSCTGGTTACGGACVNLASDAANCGACGTACGMGATCAAGRCVGGALSGPSFQLTSLDSTGCRVVDHSSLTGDDRGGIAVSNDSVFYSGDSATGRFDLETLSGASIGRVADAMLSNLRSGVVYTLANGTTPIGATGGTANTLIAFDASGALGSTRITLSESIPIASSRKGFFSGWDRGVILTGGRGYHISLPDGVVTDLGAVTFPSASTCENQGVWGVAEFFGGALYVDFVQNSTTISRMRVPGGTPEVLSRFTNLSDMCSFTVSPTRRRWYFHHEYSGQFGGSSETLGYCDAQLSAEGLMCPSDRADCGGLCRDLQRDAANCGSCGNACGAGALCIAGVCRGFSRYAAGPAPSDVGWVDVCATQRVLTSTDDSAQLVAIPFTFPWWGTLITAGSMVNVSTNGFMSLAPTLSSSLSGSIPSTLSPNSTLAPQWGDLVTGTSGICLGTVGAAPNRRWVVQWSGARNYPSSGSLNFEVILHEGTGIIDFVYGTMSGALTRTVGIENPTGTTAVGGCGGTSCLITNNTRLRFTPES